jgi:hypothetical protein
LTVVQIGEDPIPVAGSSDGRRVTLPPGEYQVIEDPNPPVPPGLNFIGHEFGSECSGTIQAGEKKTCTVSNIYAPKQRPADNYVFLEKFAPDEQFSNPDITIDKKTGNIFVADYFNNRVVKFDSSGTIITQWGSEGSGNGQFHNPQDVAIDSSGKLYVTDTHNHRIQKFDSNGQFIPGSISTNCLSKYCLANASLRMRRHNS